MDSALLEFTIVVRTLDYLSKHNRDKIGYAIEYQNIREIFSYTSKKKIQLTNSRQKKTFI